MLKATKALIFIFNVFNFIFHLKLYNSNVIFKCPHSKLPLLMKQTLVHCSHSIFQDTVHWNFVDDLLNANISYFSTDILFNWFFFFLFLAFVRLLHFCHLHSLISPPPFTSFFFPPFLLLTSYALLSSTIDPHILFWIFHFQAITMKLCLSLNNCMRTGKQPLAAAAESGQWCHVKERSRMGARTGTFRLPMAHCQRGDRHGLGCSQMQISSRRATSQNVTKITELLR